MSPQIVAATITAHHLLLNRNALFQGGLRPHAYCLPVLERETHRLALIASSAPTAPRTRAVPRSRPAAAPASTPRMRASSSTPRSSSRPARWTSWRRSPVSTAPTSTACCFWPASSPTRCFAIRQGRREGPAIEAQYAQEFGAANGWLSRLPLQLALIAAR